MIKRLSKEESQLIELYRKIKTPYYRYLSAEYIRVIAKDETGKNERIPKALECCDKIYSGFCLACEEIKDSFHGEDYLNAVDDLRESIKKDMQAAYYGKY